MPWIARATLEILPVKATTVLINLSSLVAMPVNPKKVRQKKKKAAAAAEVRTSPSVVCTTILAPGGRQHAHLLPITPFEAC